MVKRRRKGVARPMSSMRNSSTPDPRQTADTFRDGVRVLESSDCYIYYDVAGPRHGLET